jgi:hypothetical protein
MKYTVTSRTMVERLWNDVIVRRWEIGLEAFFDPSLMGVRHESITINRPDEDGEKYTIGSAFELTPCLSKNPGTQSGEPPDIL